MRRSLLPGLLFLFAFWAAPMQGAGRLIIRVVGGLPVAQTACLIAGCSIAENIDGTPGQLFLATTSGNPIHVLATLLRLVGVIDAKPDLLTQVSDWGQQCQQRC